MNEGRKAYTIVLDVFSYCNLRCPSCIVGNKFGRMEDWPKGLMTPDLLDAIITKAKSEFEIKGGIGVFNWTEPLLHPRLNELIEIINNHGVPSAISTNLNVKDSYDFERLLAARPGWMRVSLSGLSQAVYERGHAGGDIELVKRNLVSLARARDKISIHPPSFQVFFHVYTYNVHEIEPMRLFCEDLGFPFSTGYAQIFPVEKIIKISQGVVSAADQKLLATLALPLDKAIAITSRTGTKTCRLLDQVLAINVVGEVMLCCGSSMNAINTIGPFLELSIDEIQARRSRHQLCGPCLDLGIPDYFDNSPPLTQAFNEMQKAL
jgi:pyruvate-formate lyase-activating enzyme